MSDPLIYVEKESLLKLQKIQGELKKSKRGKELNKMLNKQLRVITKPIESDIRQAAKGLQFERTSKASSRANRGKYVTKGGKQKLGRGLREEIDKGVKTKIDKRPNSAGVRIAEESRLKEVNRIARSFNKRGAVSHPLFGNRNSWHLTKTSNGREWWDKAAAKELPGVRKKIEVVVDEWLRNIARGLH
jgi:hypothetical protein